jgi:hypothetical protein
MDNIEKTLRNLERMGLVSPSHAFAEQMKLVRTMPRIPDPSALAAMRVGVTMQKELERLNAGYGLGKAAREAFERNEAIGLALANSYTNLTAASSLSASTFATIGSLQKQIEALSSPVSQLRNTLSAMRAPQELFKAVNKFSVEGGLIGEFAFAPEQEQRTGEPEQETESREREEVRSRIIQVGHLPQQLFEAIANSPELMRGLAPREFEEFTADLLSRLGFTGIELTPRSGDGGRDVVATRIVNGIPIIMAFECKQYESNKIGPDILRALLGTITHGATRASMGVLVTTSSFTHGARTFLASEASIDGKDFEAISRWLVSAKGNVRAG